MYRVLVVDDEAVVREGMRDNIDWNSLGFELVGDCENGSEAMEAVDRLQPDVVLTDICMPFVDGLELTKYISGKYPHIKVIILTGYDEFEYAQQAVKLKAYDFLLKPVTANELRKILEKVEKDLDEESKKREDLDRLRMQLKESLPLLKERFLNRLVSGYLREGELEEKLKYFHIGLSGKNFLVMVVDIDDYGEFGVYHPGTDDELLLYAVFNISEELTARENSGLVFQNRNEKTIIVLSGDDPESLNDTALRLSEDIRQSVEKYLKFTVTIGIGIVSQRLNEADESYKSAISALDYRFILGKNRVINITDMERNTVNRYAYKDHWEKKLSYAVKVGTYKEIEESVENIINELKSSFMPVDRCYIHIQQIIASIANTINELGMDEREVFDNNINPFTEVYNYKTLDTMGGWLKGLGKKAADYIAHKRSDFAKLQVMKAEEYIRENYNDGNISLNAVCKHLFISTSYFSQIFKNHTGETFIEYLTRVRVEKARELLIGTGLKTYEISERVGYSDPHYFSLIFKKATSLTPTEYREKAMKENDG